MCQSRHHKRTYSYHQANKVIAMDDNTEYKPLKQRRFERYGERLDEVLKDYYVVKTDGTIINNFTHPGPAYEELKNLILETSLLYGLTCQRPDLLCV